jgi:signal transduction histidine kinase
LAQIGAPTFVFEHLTELLIIAIAIKFGLGPAVVAAFVAVMADNLLMRPPTGQFAISGYRDLLDLALFVITAIVISALVGRAHTQRRAAERAAEHERNARKELDAVISTVSHDLTTPLSVLHGTVQFARQFGPLSEADLSRLLVRLDIAATRAVSLVETLRDARDVDSHGLTLNSEIHDLHELVASVVQMFDRVSDRHPVILGVLHGPVWVRGDANRLKRVLENLVNNAIKYSPEGGAVEVSISTLGQDALVSIRDHGIGVNPEALPRIFDRSFRAAEAERVAPGLGLGLSIASQVVALHGGTLDIRPAEGKGTVASLKLPLAADTTEEYFGHRAGTLSA